MYVRVLLGTDDTEVCLTVDSGEGIASVKLDLSEVGYLISRLESEAGSTSVKPDDSEVNSLLSWLWSAKRVLEGRARIEAYELRMSRAKEQAATNPDYVRELRVGDMVHVVGDDICRPAFHTKPLTSDDRQWFMIVDTPRNIYDQAAYGHSVNQWHWPDECKGE